MSTRGQREAARSQAQLTDSVFESLIRVGLGSTKLKQTQFQDVSIALDSLPTGSDGEVSEATKRALLESIAEQSGVALADVQLLEAEGGRSDQADGHAAAAAFTVRVLDASGGKRSSSAAVEAKTSAIEGAVADGTVAASMRRRGVEVEEFDASLEECAPLCICLRASTCRSLAVAHHSPRREFCSGISSGCS